MTAELPTSFRFVLRVLSIPCLLLFAQFASAQTPGNYCEPSAAVKADFKKIVQLDDEDVPYRVRRERELAMLQELLKKYPGDFHVQRRYQIARLGGYFVDREPLLAEYRAQMEKNPSDPKAVYLYARLIYGQQTKDAIEILNKLAQQAPDFPWTHIHLADIYSVPNFRDAAKSKEQLKLWLTKCPTVLHGVSIISRGGDTELMAAAAQRLRSRLQSSTDSSDLEYWENLWTIEFKLKPVPEHAQVRKQIVEDLKHIRESNQGTRDQLEALRTGYKQVADKTGEHWAEDELIRLFPKSYNARSIIQRRYYDAHKYPQGEVTEAQRQAYNEALAQVAAEWIKQWPNDEFTWSTRLRALTELEGTSTADVEAAYNGYAKAHAQGGGYSLPPIEVAVARFYLKRGFRLESIPDLLEKSVAQIEQAEKRNQSDLYPQRSEEDSNLRYVRSEEWPLLAETYARLKQPDKAREVLARLNGLGKRREQPTDEQKRSFAYAQTVYWSATGKVAEVEQRKLDAMTAYQTALAFRTYKQTGKDELSDNAQRLWKELGGTDQGWEAYLARTEASKSKVATAEVATWDTKNTDMAAFDLTDLQGRKWSLADLKGKVALINLWATWCGPCRVELPYVQKLREQMKDKKDVLILTLNTDEDVGMVEPFMKENKFSFPVLLGQAYADGQGVNSIPRNWIVSADGKIVYEGIGFGNNGDEWIKKATDMLEKVKGANK